MKFVLTLFLITGLCYKTFADLGNCVRYEIEIQKADGARLKGFVDVGGYELRLKFAGDSFSEYVLSYAYNDTLLVYKNIQELKFPVDPDALPQGRCQFHFAATPVENTVKIPKKEIKSARMISYSTCHNCSSKDEKQGYTWQGFSPNVITELTQSEIDMLQTAPIASLRFGYGDVNLSLSGFNIISYSKSMGKPELEIVRNEFLDESREYLKKNDYPAELKRYQLLKAELRKKKVVIFRTESAA